MRKLTVKQRLFVTEYLKDLNATQAARRTGYSSRNADKIGSQLLAHSRVRAAIQNAMDQRAKRAEISADRVLQELARLAFLDPRKFYKDDGSLIPVHELDADTAAALAGMEIEEAYEHFGKGQAKPVGQLKKIKFADKGQNLERLGRHLKLFTDRVDVTAEVSIAEAIRKARLRKEAYERSRAAEASPN